MKLRDDRIDCDTPTLMLSLAALPKPPMPPAVLSAASRVLPNVVLPQAYPGLALAAVQLAGALTTDFKGGTPTPYGKFAATDEAAAGPSLPSKVGMLMIYGPALAVCALGLRTALAAAAAAATAKVSLSIPHSTCRKQQHASSPGLRQRFRLQSQMRKCAHSHTHQMIIKQ